MAAGTDASSSFPQRKRIRLPHYDYSSQGAYFLTICTFDKRCLFGEVVGDHVMLNSYGRVAEACWLEIPAHFPGVELDWHVVMPNHVHGVVMLFPDSAATIYRGPTTANGHRAPDSAPTFEAYGHPVAGSASTVVRCFKAAVSRQLNVLPHRLPRPYWQPKYYDHIIRSEKELRDIRRYIEENPLKWSVDQENPEAE